MSKPLPLTLGAVALLLLSLISLPGRADDERYLDVSGRGEVTAAPDYLQLHLQISATDNNVQLASDAVNRSMQQLLSTASEYGVAQEDIDAAQIQRQPVWEWKSDGREYRGERISRNVTLTLRDLQQHTALVHNLLPIDGLRLQNSALRFSDPAALEIQALELAVQKAQHKAQKMAAALGSRLGKVLRIEEGGSPVVPFMELRSAAVVKAEAEPAPLLIQAQTISADVRVRFELK